MNERQYVCTVCGNTYEVSGERIVCDCGGPLGLRAQYPRLPDDLSGRSCGLTRYKEAIALDEKALAACDLGSYVSPLLHMGESVFAKCDYRLPSGSFKDRGAAAMVALALELGEERLVVDSSGNAAAALSAHGARAGLDVTVVVPTGAPEGKLVQIRAYGSKVEIAPGTRAEAARLARAIVDESSGLYAAHAYNPFFLEGTKSWAFEVWEQLGGCPDAVVMPVGSGSLLLGVYAGFTYLQSIGRCETIPRLVAVQASGWAPLVGDLSRADGPTPLTDGIAIANPFRKAEILAAISNSGGEVVVVNDDEVAKAYSRLAKGGIWVEPTAAAAWAAVERMTGHRRTGQIVVNLGGAGYKKPISA